MEAAIIVFGIFMFLAVFNAGNMVTLHIQHYGIYKFAGETNFKEYMKANNRSALIPSILPAMLLLILSIILLFFRPNFMTQAETIVVLFLNLIALFSTFKWQRKLQGELAETGYDINKINKLVSTNILRMSVFLIQAVLAVYITIINLNR